MSASDAFRAPINYPPGFRTAVTPDLVDPNFCVHDANPPICNCVHDWRIEWGNVKKKPARNAVL